MEATDRKGADSPLVGVGSFGLMLFQVALSVLFASTVVATWYFRDQAAAWSDSRPSLPVGLWVATAMLGFLSYFAEQGARRSARGHGASAHRAILAAGACALIFLAAQTWNWSELLAHRPRGEHISFYEFNFYLLTLLHAFHVLGGMVYLVLALLQAKSAAPRAAGMARLNAAYWHFLAGVWVVILLNLLLTRVEDPASTALGPTSLGLLGLAVAACLAYQWVAIRDFRAHGKPGLAAWSILPPFAFLAYWAHAGDWGRERTLARWTLASLITLALALVAVAVHSDALFVAEGPGSNLLPGVFGR